MTTIQAQLYAIWAVHPADQVQSQPAADAADVATACAIDIARPLVARRVGRWGCRWNQSAKREDHAEAVDQRGRLVVGRDCDVTVSDCSSQCYVNVRRDLRVTINHEAIDRNAQAKTDGSDARQALARQDDTEGRNISH